MSVYNAQADGLTVPNLVIAVACFSGSFAQIAAGSWGMSLTIFPPRKRVIDHSVQQNFSVATYSAGVVSIVFWHVITSPSSF